MIFVFLCILLIVLQQDQFTARYPANCEMEITGKQFSNGDRNQHLTLVTKFVVNRTIGPTKNIPYYIFQTHQKDMIPWQMNYAVGTIIQKNPEFTYRYFNATERRQFIYHHLGKEVGAVYDKLVPNAYRADLWRYSVVYVYGGCYIDIAMIEVEGLRGLIKDDTNFISTPDGNKNRYYGVNSAFFCAAPGHGILKNAINGIVKLTYQQSYGNDMLEVSGPLRFLDGFFQHYNISNNEREVTYTKAIEYPGKVFLYQRDQLSPNCVQANIQDYNNNIILYNKYPNYSNDAELFSGKPHYAILYRKKKLYNQSIDLPPITSNFTIKSIENLNPFDRDYRIAFQFQNSSKSS